MDAMPTDSVAWVVGSGFSRSLGGPLLDELFDEHRFRRLRAPRWEVDLSAWERVYSDWSTVFHLFRRLDRPGGTARPWRNAEEYVELLQLAGSGDAAALHVLYATTGADPWDKIMPRVGSVATKYLAAVTAEFVQDAAMDTERWKPYRRWIARVRENDAIITFNYDRVLEMAHQADVRASASPVAAPRISKLHGSVDWSYDEHRRLVKGQNPWSIIADPTKDVALGVPGPAKIMSSANEFVQEWNHAAHALRSADIIVFIGYRFPETDSHAKQTLLTAIRENHQTTSHHLTVRIVLGPKRGDDAERLEGMLRWTLSHRRDARGASMPRRLAAGPGGAVRRENAPPAQTYTILHEPMWAEDFMTVFDRARMESR
jgi:hypothetical protein